MPSAENQRRTGGSTFKPDWELSSLFMSDNGDAKHSVFGCVANWHYKQKHLEELDSTLDSSRKEKIKKFKKELALSTNIEKSDESKLLANSKWVAALLFHADIICHLNDLNI
ncbi:Protein of unknown function, partial [Gryllus bimaculatus]